MTVVSDTSPINYLLQIGLIDLLRQLFGSILIPTAVEVELEHPSAPDLVRGWIRNPPQWVAVQHILTDKSLLGLGIGEQEAITLAILVEADIVLIDDRKARHVAADRGLVVSGTLNLLDAAAERGLIDLPQALAALLKTNFRASTDVIRAILSRDTNSRR
ncbi:MAG TPA: DUF3368 domain-containing protein [Blastocatellia bacterium]|nr:DUF3368 domain-containing protein [Blastocatellia bacterium]